MDGSRLGLKPTMTGQERKTDREKKNPEPTRKTEHNKRGTEIYDVLFPTLQISSSYVTFSTMKGKKNPEGPHKGPSHLHAWTDTPKKRNKRGKKEEKEKKRVRNEKTSPHTLIYKNPFISSPDVPSKTFFHFYISSYIYVICNRVKSKVYRV